MGTWQRTLNLHFSPAGMRTLCRYIILFCIINCMRGREDVSVAICAAVRDIPENVLEWVRYHSFIGICKFYLMVTDDPEVANMETVLQSEIDIGLVELYSLPYVNPRTVSQLQVRLYGLCLESVRCVRACVVHELLGCLHLLTR